MYRRIDHLRSSALATLRRWLLQHTLFYNIRWPVVGGLNALEAVQALGYVPRVRHGAIELRYEGGEVE